MTPPENPLESRLFQAWWDDGLLDLLSGVALLGIGTAWSFGLPALGAVVPALLVPLWGPLRRRLVEPRAGYVEFSRSRKRRSTRGLVRTVALGGVALVLAVAAILLLRGKAPGDAARHWIAGLPAALLALMAGIASLLTGARRFELYAALLLLCGVATVLVDAGPAAPMLAMGAVLLATGIVLLRRFLAGSPDPTGEDA